MAGRREITGGLWNARRLLLAGLALIVVVPPMIIVASTEGDRQEVPPATDDVAEEQVVLSSEASVKPGRMPPVAFSRLNDGQYQLFATDRQGEVTVRVAERRGMFPAWSQDGRRLAFVTEALGFTRMRLGLAVIEPDGTIDEVLSGPQVPSHPSFDRATGSIVYQSAIETQSGAAGTASLATIDRVDISGGQQRTIIDEGGAVYHPAVAPDGERIAVVVGVASCEQCPQRLIVYDREGEPARTIIDEGVAAGPAWSPDGRRIAFSWARGSQPAIWIVDVASGELTRLTSGTSADAEPSWAPDGTEIAFARDCDVFVKPLDGDVARKLTHSQKCDISPAWRPRAPG